MENRIKHIPVTTSDDINRIESYLLCCPKRFWDKAKEIIEKPYLSISGYCTTYNCVSQKYPFVECISSMLEFCDEVCVVDGGSTDETRDLLKMLANNKLRVKMIDRDWESPQSALFDGMQKAEARDMCTGDFCWQMDVDEVVSEDDAKKVRPLCERMLENGLEGLSLAVVEYWGSENKVRCDVHPWKWRLSRNNPMITHGIPTELRGIDDKGNLYCTGGSDGCDMVYRDTGTRVPFANFYTQEAHDTRLAALQGNEQARVQYEQWFNSVIEQLPGVFHYSWIDIRRKIRLYRDFWTKHWLRLSAQDDADTAEHNMFFDVPWSQVTEEMIDQRANELEQIGGWVFHQKWNRTRTPWITCKRKSPLGALNRDDTI